MVTKILCKGSGDLTRNKNFLNFCRQKAAVGHVTVICGGAIHVTRALAVAGYESRWDEAGNRITATDREREIAQRTLEEEAIILNRRFRHPNITVIPALLYEGDRVTHINGDELTKRLMAEFDAVYVFTLGDRRKKKEKAFADCPGIEIIGL